MSIQKILHLIRYFLILGLVAFIGYTQHLQETVFLILTGPCLYIAYNLKHLISAKLIKLDPDSALNFYAFLLPTCLLYYGFIGFQLKQLFNERGSWKWLLIIIFLAFIIAAHYLAYKTLSSYTSANF